MILRTTIGAFLISPQSTEAFESLREDRLFLRSDIVLQQGGLNAACSYLGDHETPPVLIVETEARGEALLAELARLAEVCAPKTRVFVIGHDNDIHLYRTLIREGVSDYFLAPVTTDMLRQSFQDNFTEADAAKNARLIAFLPARGGVGSSVLAHHTAFALSKLYHEQVIVLDLDLPYGTAGLVFNVLARQSVADVLGQLSRLDEMLLERYLVPYEPSENKVSVLPAPSTLTSGVNVTSEGLAVLLKFVRRMAGFVVLDLPHVWEPWLRDLIVEVEDLVIVAEPDLASLRDAKNIIEFLGPNRGESPTRVVLNKIGEAKRAELSEKEFRDALALTPALQIPADPGAFSGALNNGELIFKGAAKSKAALAINELAKMVSARVDAAAEKEKKKFSLFKKK
ncbi:MAG: pilus assembly protein CpaF [Magnetospirillum sp. WYHS-4]